MVETGAPQTTGTSITVGGITYNSWEPTYTTVDNTGRSVQVGNPYYNPTHVAPTQAAAAVATPQYSPYGYEILPEGATPKPGETYASGYGSGVYRVNQYGSTEFWNVTEFNPNAPKEIIPAPGPTGLYLSYVGGKTASVSAIYTPGAEPYVPNPYLQGGMLYNPNTGNFVSGGGNIIQTSIGWTGERGQPQATAYELSHLGESKNEQARAQDAELLALKGGKDFIVTSGDLLYDAKTVFPASTPKTAGTNDIIYSDVVDYNYPVRFEAGSPEELKAQQTMFNETLYQKGSYEISPGIFIYPNQNIISESKTNPAFQYFNPTTNTPLVEGNKVIDNYSLEWFGAAGSSVKNIVEGGVLVFPAALKGYGEAWGGFVDTNTKAAADSASLFTGGLGSRQINVTQQYIGGLVGGIPSFVASVPYGIGWSVFNPEKVPSKAFEIGTGMVNYIAQQEEERPGSMAGITGSMWAGGKVLAPYTPSIGAVFEKPLSGNLGVLQIDINTKIPVQSGEGFNRVSTLFTKNPFVPDVSPTPRVYVMYGEEIGGIKYGRGSPVPAAINEGISVKSPSLFSVRSGEFTPTPAQLRFLDPFFREVSKGTPPEVGVNAMFDLKRLIPGEGTGYSERVLNYKLEQPAGSVERIGVNPEVQAGVHEVLAKYDSIRLGSSSTTDFVGQKFMRDTTKSDIDVDIPEKYYDTAIAEIAEVYKKNPKEVIQNGGQFAFKEDVNALLREGVPTEKAWKEAHIFAAGKVELHPDVAKRPITVATKEGTPIKQASPEYGIESKLSRMFGRESELSYSKETGIKFNIEGKKAATDYADIYFGARGIAKTAFKQGEYELGRSYEDVSNKIKGYAQQTGNAEKIDSVPNDMLKGVPRYPIRPGSILGVGFDFGKTPKVSNEYPPGKASVPKKGGVATATVIGIASASEYPAGKASMVETYPVSYTPTVASDSYPIGIQTKNSTTYAYPTSTTTSPTTYPSGVVPTSTSYPTSTTTYPTGTTIPATTYPISVIPPPPTYPTGTTTYPTATTKPEPSPFIPRFNPNAPTTKASTSFPLIIPNKFVPIIKDEQIIDKSRTRRQKGKRFGEVFGMDIRTSLPGGTGFKTPKRLLEPNFRTTPKQFTESFSMGNLNLLTAPTVNKRRRKTR